MDLDYQRALKTGDLTAAVLEDQTVVQGRITKATTHHVEIALEGGRQHTVHRRYTLNVDLDFALRAQLGQLAI